LALIDRNTHQPLTSGVERRSWTLAVSRMDMHSVRLDLLAPRDPPLDPVDRGWHLCQFARAKWQSYMSAYRCPQAHLRDPHATFASCVLCSQPSLSSFLFGECSP